MAIAATPVGTVNSNRNDALSLGWSPGTSSPDLRLVEHVRAARRRTSRPIRRNPQHRRIVDGVSTSTATRCPGQWIRRRDDELRGRRLEHTDAPSTRTADTTGPAESSGRWPDPPSCRCRDARSPRSAACRVVLRGHRVVQHRPSCRATGTSSPIPFVGRRRGCRSGPASGWVGGRFGRRHTPVVGVVVGVTGGLRRRGAGLRIGRHDPGRRRAAADRGGRALPPTLLCCTAAILSAVQGWSHVGP